MHSTWAMCVKLILNVSVLMAYLMLKRKINNTLAVEILFDRGCPFPHADYVLVD